jgi:translation initiation factor 4A
MSKNKQYLFSTNIKHTNKANSNSTNNTINSSSNFGSNFGLNSSSNYNNSGHYSQNQRKNSYNNKDREYKERNDDSHSRQYNKSKDKEKEENEDDFELTKINAKEDDEEDEKIFKKNFDEFKLKEDLLRGIYSYGFESPSRIQCLAIPHILEKKDLVAQAQAGTGKTAAFTIGTLSMINEKETFPQAIIMSNTRELADQINSVVCDLSKYMGINTCLSIGGASVKENEECVKKSQIIIGTPGRIKHLIENKKFDVGLIKIFIIDEADELLKKDFLEQTKEIICSLPKDTQICVFSATMPKDTLDVTEKFMNKPVYLLIKKERLTLDLVTQYYIDVQNDSCKYDTIADLYSKLCINQCIIFVNSIERAEWLYDKLQQDKHEVVVIHRKIPNLERINIMKKFRKGEFRVLIATDLMCRGIDVQQVSYVINYDLPSRSYSSYIHRIGRSGRYGKRGVAINLITRRDYGYIKDLQYYYKTNIEEMPDPSVLNEYIGN